MAIFGRLRGASVNQTILRCAEWGQITVSYTVLPFRRSRATKSPSLAPIPPEKHGQIKIFLGRLGPWPVARILLTGRGACTAPVATYTRYPL